MPNIEIHGLGPVKARQVKRRVINCVRRALTPGIGEETVITTCKDRVTDISGTKQPFLRIFNTTEETNSNLIKVLKSLGFDIEFVVLEDFIPAERVVEQVW